MTKIGDFTTKLTTQRNVQVATTFSDFSRKLTTKRNVKTDEAVAYSIVKVVTIIPNFTTKLTTNSLFNEFELSIMT